MREEVEFTNTLARATDSNRKSNVSFFGMILLLATDRKRSCWWLWLDITNAMAYKRSRKGKIQFPVAVRDSKTSAIVTGCEFPRADLASCIVAKDDFQPSTGAVKTIWEWKVKGYEATKTFSKEESSADPKPGKYFARILSMQFWWRLRIKLQVPLDSREYKSYKT